MDLRYSGTAGPRIVNHFTDVGLESGLLRFNGTALGSFTAPRLNATVAGESIRIRQIAIGGLTASVKSDSRTLISEFQLPDLSTSGTATYGFNSRNFHVQGAFENLQVEQLRAFAPTQTKDLTGNLSGSFLVDGNARSARNAAAAGLRPANPRNKDQAHEFLSRLVVRGGTNPLPALEAAFRMKPQLIFFLTDGRFDSHASYDDVKNTILQLNDDKSVMINTIQFMNRDSTAEQVLREIAAENGGKYKYIGEEDL
jgi:hypothetical protein